MSSPPAAPAADTAIAISRRDTAPSGGKSEDLRPSFDGNARELGPIAWRNTLPDLPEYFSTHPDAGKRAEPVGRAGSGGGPAMPPGDWQAITELCRTVANS